MAIKKSELYSTFWAGCDELRGSMDASQYKNYVLVLLFMAGTDIAVPFLSFSVSPKFRTISVGAIGIAVPYPTSLSFFCVCCVTPRYISLTISGSAAVITAYISF